jgi:hypothetical protein
MIKKKRPVFNLLSKLEDVPGAWLKHIEPHIQRDFKTHGHCWLWTGAMDRDGEATMHYRGIDGKYHRRRAKRFVAELFYSFEDHDDVVQSCGKLNCMHPSHVTPVNTHYKQRKEP